MFETFLSQYRVDDLCKKNFHKENNNKTLETEHQFLKYYSGMSFNNGIYRLHSRNEIKKWNSILGEAFPEFSKRIDCYAYDWLGRHFVMDKSRVVNSKEMILMLEPGTGEVLEIPLDFEMFHEDELINYSNELLASDFYNDWLQNEGLAPLTFQCVGYKKPLFLGGKDTVHNLEISNMEVYWSLSSQLIRKVKNLEIGSGIDNFSIT